jgi:hypothetical protein
MPLVFKMPDSVKTADEYWEVLRDTFGYTNAEARKHAPMRMSAVAIPITDRSEVSPVVIGVIYCDSSDREFFDEEIVELCVLTGITITDHIRLAS